MKMSNVVSGTSLNDSLTMEKLESDSCLALSMSMPIVFYFMIYVFSVCERFAHLSVCVPPECLVLEAKREHQIPWDNYELPQECSKGLLAAESSLLTLPLPLFQEQVSLRIPS